MGACASRVGGSSHVRPNSAKPDGAEGSPTEAGANIEGRRDNDRCNSSSDLATMPGAGATAGRHTAKDGDSGIRSCGSHKGSSFSDSWQSSEDASNGVGKHDSGGGNPKLQHMQSSKLEEHARRRLSVSTVQAAPGAGERGVVGAVPNPLGIGSGDLAALAAAAAVTPPAAASGSPPKGGQRRSLIKKFSDPALQLVDERRGAIQEVSVSMILDLVPNAHSSLAYFGAPSWDVQKGFDNKDVEVSGSLANKVTLTDLGIGYACKKGLKPESPNQDDFFILRLDDWGMYGVFDGHGPCGHEVSNFVHTALPFLIISDPQFEEDTPATLRRAFRKVHHLLEAAAEQADARLDCTLSGTTGTVVVHRDDKLYVAHVGDSRAVIAQRGRPSDKKFASMSLTLDHKPTIEIEKSRIEAHGGEVRRLEGDIPFRVFVKNRMYPGLAMSRAIGDTVGAAVGVISDPDVRVLELRKEDVFYVISTDGVWEFISSQECVDFCSRKPRKLVQEAAEFLAYESWRRWVEEEDNVVDDVTCVVIYV